MPIKRRKKTTYSFAVKRGKSYKPMPRLTKKQERDLILGKRKLPALYVVKKRGKRVVKAQKL